MNKIKKVEKTKQITDSLLQVSKSVKTENLGERVIEKKNSLGSPSYLAVYGIIALLCVALLGCPPSSNSTDPVAGMFPYICPNGTAKPGMTTTEDSVSCTACTSPATLVGTECMLPAVASMFPYTCPNGTAQTGMTTTEDSVSCTACNSSYTEVEAECILTSSLMFPYACPNGTAQTGMTTTEDSVSCTACNSSYTQVGTECILTASLVPFVCPNGTAKSGMTTMQNQISCASCDDDEGFHLKSEQCLSFDGTFTQVGSAANFGAVNEQSPSGLASIGDILYMVNFSTVSTGGALYSLGLAGATAGVANLIRTFTARVDARGLASIGNTLYLVGSFHDDLFTLDPSSGNPVQVDSGNNFAGSENYPRGLASITANDGTTTLYMVGGRGDIPANRYLYIVSTSDGSITRVGAATSFGVGETAPYGLASIDNTLYMVGQTNDALYRLNTSTGVATQVGSAVDFGIGGADTHQPAGLASIGQTLYMVDDSARNALFKAELPTP